MEEAIKKAEVLTEALPYIKKYYDRIVVVKMGGSLMDDREAERQLLRDVVFMNPRAEELGLVRERLLDDRAWIAAQRTLMTGESRDVDLTQRRSGPPGRATLSVRGHVRLLTREDRRFAVVFAHDQSDYARMEATRRDFVANVSHEIRTPLTVLAGFVETLQTLSLTEQERSRYMGMMAQQAQFHAMQADGGCRRHEYE